jgi:predicted RNA-binding Zn-ribbon protein involved in translation (DUF1610 family)
MLRRHRAVDHPTEDVDTSDLGGVGFNRADLDGTELGGTELGGTEFDGTDLQEEDEAATWCETCRQRVDPELAGDDGTCPDCGEALVSRRNVPWTFKLMLVATVVYLGYRLYQGIGWAIHHA